LNDADLRIIEEVATGLAEAAGKLLMGYFGAPLEVSYKAPNSRSPVTDADNASDAYLRQEIRQRFPTHAILSEEGTQEEERDTDVVWVLDPLDGTMNFMNGLPAFGVSIAVLERAQPVVGALFIPGTSGEDGLVLHARAGGGAWCNGVRLALPKDQMPGNSLLASVPGYFRAGFHISPRLRGQLGEVRSTGSIAYEMAYTAKGVFQYSAFGSSRIWDVAGGILLVQEAGGAVFQWRSKASAWTAFQSFAADGAGTLPTQRELRPWRGTLVLGNATAAPLVAGGLRPRTFRWRRMGLQTKQWLWPGKKRQPQEGSEKPAQETPKG
jgi:myo-inositol-1(or 4)-monophosphatase